jgi:hypothetical protein
MRFPRQNVLDCRTHRLLVESTTNSLYSPTSTRQLSHQVPLPGRILIEHLPVVDLLKLICCLRCVIALRDIVCCNSISSSLEQFEEVRCEDYVSAFFAQYPGFRYNPSTRAQTQFDNMCKVFEWDKGNLERANALRELKDALIRQFNGIYGIDVDSLENWKNLCRVLEILPVPRGLNDCRNVCCNYLSLFPPLMTLQAVLNTHVNIVELVETHRTGQPVRKFKTEKALSKYTQVTEQYFPKRNALAGGLLRFLLRHILNPRHSTRRSWKEKPVRRR